MADIVSELASKCGIPAETAQKGLGLVLGLLKLELPTDAFAKVSAAVPNADSMISSAADLTGHGSAGVLEAVKGAVGKLLGGSDPVAALTSQFTKLGMTPDQVTSFMPQVMEFLKNKLPPAVMDQISHLLPIHEEAAH
jgi:hypothetical protein